MSYPVPVGLERWPMSLEEFLELPDYVRVEWVDGVAIVSAVAKRPHNRISRRLANVIEASLPDLEIDTASGVRISERRYRIPDVSALEAADAVERFTEQTPILVVEVVSPSTRREDLLRKNDEYRLAGIGQYWIVDPDDPSLTVQQNATDSWRTVLELTEDNPVGVVVVGEHGDVALDLRTLLA